MSTGDCLAAGAIEVGDSGLDIRPRRCRFAPLQVSPASPRVVAIEPRYTRRTRRLAVGRVLRIWSLELAAPASCFGDGVLPAR
jgi:hypothetical protein